MRGRRYTLLLSLALAAIVTLLVFFSWRTTVAHDLNLLSYDLTVDRAASSSTSKDVVVVDFDEDTFSHIQRYPIPRDIIANVIRRVGEAKPKVIGLDMYLSEPRETAQDKAMQEALTGAGNVILASQAALGTLPRVRPLALFCQPEDNVGSSGFCKENTPGAMGYAFVNMPVDNDGFIRRSILLNESPAVSLSLPVMLAQQATGQPITPKGRNAASLNGKTIQYENPESKTILIGTWAPEPALHISAWDVLEGKVSVSDLQDRVVLIGQSNDAARDIHLTPLFRLRSADGSRLRMSGTEIHAAALRSILEGRVFHQLDEPWFWTIVFLASYLAAWLSLRLPLNIGVFVNSGLVVIALVISAVVLHFARIWIPWLPLQASMALTLPLGLAVQFIEERVLRKQELQQRQQLMHLFSEYVDPKVAHRIWLRRDMVDLDGEERMATVMFSDIRNFTSLTAGKAPSTVLAWLNEYLTAMDEVIRQHDGFLNKFIGDGLMIIFGVPLSRGEKDDACRAIHAALAMLQRVEEMNARHLGDPNFPSIRIGIGIHTGLLMAGSIGSQNRKEYSVIGETVNLASRLESLNKHFQTHILVSSATYERVHPQCEGFRALGAAKVVGFQEPVEVFALGPPLETQLTAAPVHAVQGV